MSVCNALTTKTPTFTGSPNRRKSFAARDALPSSPTAWVAMKAARKPAGWPWKRFATSTTATSPAILRGVLLAAFQAAHDMIQRYGFDHPQFHGMGTTCTALSIIDRQLYFAHVGDSRLYLVRTGAISRLTRDHSYVGRLVENGIVRSEDAESHPQRHILTAALGSGRDVVPHASDQPMLLGENDILILCTDGLWSLVPEADLARVVQAHSPAEACTHLVKMALDRGGPDNITLQILRIGAR